MRAPERVRKTRRIRPAPQAPALEAIQAAAGASPLAALVGRPAIEPRVRSAGARFRVPSLRPRLLPRERLARALGRAIAEHPLVLVVAGAGFGKTTLIAQGVSALSPDHRVLWIAADRLDRSPVRMFHALVESVNSLDPDAAPLDADTLTRMLQSGEQGGLAAAHEIADWLAESDIARIVWVWDDVHVLNDEASWRWLDRLLELLPARVCCVVASRTTPPLALARRRAQGLVAEIAQQQLCLTPEETADFLSRAGRRPSDARIAALQSRTQGWVAGLQLLASEQAGRSAASRDAAPGFASLNADDAPVFEFFAEEVLAKLPAELAKFVSACSVLQEFGPRRAAALTGATDSAQRIDALVRRNVFVGVVDPSGPVVRIHDLFRDFLTTRMRRLDPESWRALNRSAAAIVDDPIHSAHHAIEAQDAAEALRTLAENAQQLVRRGRAEAVDAILQALPDELRTNSTDALWVAGIVANHRTAIDETRSRLDAAARGFAARGDAIRHARSLLMAARAASYAGDLAGARDYLAQLDDARIDDATCAELELERGWLAAASGDPESAAAALRRAIEIAESESSPDLCAVLAERIRTHFVTIPGFVGLFERFHDLVRSVQRRTDTPLFAHSTVLAVWAALWDGECNRARELHDALWIDVERWRTIRPLYVDLCMSRSFLAAMAGDYDEASALMDELIESGQAHTIGLRSTWVGTYLYMKLRIHWVAGDEHQARQTYARLLTAQAQAEWPFMDFARQYAEGMFAYLSGEFERSRALFAGIAEAQRRFPVLKLAGDLRLAAARCHLALGQGAQAWLLADAVLGELLDEGAIGPLLIEAPGLLDELIALVPQDQPRSGAYRALLARARSLLEHGRPHDSAASDAALAPFGALTHREREVLAQVARGASNKRIALDLNLSLHTVKRHVANIIAKLGVRSRGEAIARVLRTPD